MTYTPRTHAPCEEVLVDGVELGGCRGPREVYAPAWVQVLRAWPGTMLCVASRCKLSGGMMHIGPCIACSCGAMHAIAECEKELK